MAAVRNFSQTTFGSKTKAQAEPVASSQLPVAVEKKKIGKGPKKTRKTGKMANGNLFSFPFNEKENPNRTGRVTVVAL